jgi:hypothetical protein
MGSTYQGQGTGRSKRRKRKAQNTRPKTKRRRRRPPPVTHEVIGIRCRVYEVMLLEQTLVLADEVDGREFEVPLSMLVGKDTLAQIEKGEAVWLSVRREKPRVRNKLGLARFDDVEAIDDQYDEGHGP